MAETDNINLSNLRYGSITAKQVGGSCLVTYTNEAIGLDGMQVVDYSLHGCLMQLSSYFIMLERVTGKAIHDGNINSNYYDTICKSAKEVYELL